MTLKSSSYLLPKFSRAPFSIVLISGVSTRVNGTLSNFGKRYEDGLRVIFDQWQKLHIGLDALSNQKILNSIYCICTVIGRAQHQLGRVAGFLPPVSFSVFDFIIINEVVPHRPGGTY